MSDEQIRAIIAEALFHYRDPPNSRFWGIERAEDKARIVLEALRSRGVL